MFISNFLTDRNFQVRIGSTLSDPFSQEMGVPQGSILSPLLFNLKINNIVKAVKPDIDKSLFVDLSISKGKILAGVERQLQLCINGIQKWVDENGFRFSITKTECIHFQRKRNQVLQPSLHVNNQPIKVSNQVKFLGVIFDSKLSFLPHIKIFEKQLSEWTEHPEGNQPYRLGSRQRNPAPFVNLLSAQNWIMVVLCMGQQENLT